MLAYLFSLFSSSTLSKILYLIGEFVRFANDMKLSTFKSFFTTNDMWTSTNGHKFLTVTYHSIAPDSTFLPWNATLDLIPIYSRTFAETLACVLDSKRKHHSRFQPNILHSGDSTDRGANAKKGSLLFVGEEDHQDCFNHGLKTCCDVVYGSTSSLGSAKQASKDFNSLHYFNQYVRNHSELKQMLTQIQIDRVQFTDCLTVIADNATRWDGKYETTKRTSLLSEHIPKLIAHNTTTFKGKHLSSSLLLFFLNFLDLFESLGNMGCKDAMSESFFERNVKYEAVLKPIHIISKLGQSTMLPTQSSMIYWIHQLLQTTTPKVTDDLVTKEFKEVLHVFFFFLLFSISSTSFSVRFPDIYY